jgi:hypothetical protein
MQTTQSVNQELSDESPAEYEAKRKALDPAPWIRPATMERFSEQPSGTAFCVYHPRLTWPEHGGRMVRRDYLRPGDRAVSSHYGKRIVQSVRTSGTEGQTTTIIWAHSTDDRFPFSESYDSSLMIELLPKGE